MNQDLQQLCMLILIGVTALPDSEKSSTYHFEDSLSQGNRHACCMPAVSCLCIQQFSRSSVEQGTSYLLDNCWKTAILCCKMMALVRHQCEQSTQSFNENCMVSAQHSSEAHIPVGPVHAEQQSKSCGMDSEVWGYL